MKVFVNFVAGPSIKFMKCIATPLKICNNDCVILKIKLIMITVFDYN